MIVVAVLALIVVAGLFLWLVRPTGDGGRAEAKSPGHRDPGTIYRDEYLDPEAEQRALTLDSYGLPTAELRRVKDRLVIVTRDGMVNPRSRSLHRVGLHVFQVRGTDHYQPASEHGDFRPGKPVRLFREPHNPYDANAVAVFADNHDDLVGYANKQKAARLAKLIDSGADVVAISLRGGGPRTADVVPTVLAAERHVMDHLTRKL